MKKLRNFRVIRYIFFKMGISFLPMSIFLILIAALIEKGKKPHNKIITEIGLRFALLLQSLTHANKQSAQSLKGSGVVFFFPPKRTDIFFL